MVSKWVISYNLLINEVHWGYNPLIRSPLILTSCPGHPGSEKRITDSLIPLKLAES